VQTRIARRSAQIVARLDRFETAADVRGERLVHVGHKRACAAAEVHAERDEFLCERARIGVRTHERAASGLHVVHDRLGAAGDLLRDDGSGYQADTRNRSGAIAQGVEFLIGRDEARALRCDCAPDAIDLRDERRRAQIRPHAGDRLEFVERAAGMSERAAREFRHGDAARSDERNDDERNSIADTAAGVFVDARHGAGRKRDRVAGVDHGLRERENLRIVDAANDHGHRECGHLRIVDRVARIGRDDVGPRRGVERFAVTFAFDRTAHLQMIHRAGVRGPASEPR